MKVKADTLGNGEAMAEEFAKINYNPRKVILCPKCYHVLPYTHAMLFCNWCGEKLDYAEVSG